METIVVVFGWPLNTKPQEDEIALTVKYDNGEEQLYTTGSLDHAYSFIKGAKAAASKHSDLRIDVVAPILYVPMYSSGMYHCTGCHDLRGQQHDMRHKKECPNFKEERVPTS